MGKIGNFLNKIINYVDGENNVESNITKKQKELKKTVLELNKVVNILSSHENKIDYWIIINGNFIKRFSSEEQANKVFDELVKSNGQTEVLDNLRKIELE